MSEVKRSLDLTRAQWRTLFVVWITYGSFYLCRVNIGPARTEIEKSFIVQALAKTEGNVTRAAKLLQISRKSLQTKMKEFGLRDEEPVAEE